MQWCDTEFLKKNMKNLKMSLRFGIINSKKRPKKIKNWLYYENDNQNKKISIKKLLIKSNELWGVSNQQFTYLNYTKWNHFYKSFLR